MISSMKTIRKNLLSSQNSCQLTNRKDGTKSPLDNFITITSALLIDNFMTITIARIDNFITITSAL
jgi:hypothetical protein